MRLRETFGSLARCVWLVRLHPDMHIGGTETFFTRKRIFCEIALPGWEKLVIRPTQYGNRKRSLVLQNCLLPFHARTIRVSLRVTAFSSLPDVKYSGKPAAHTEPSLPRNLCGLPCGVQIDIFDSQRNLLALSVAHFFCRTTTAEAVSTNRAGSILSAFPLFFLSSPVCAILFGERRRREAPFLKHSL